MLAWLGHRNAGPDLGSDAVRGGMQPLGLTIGRDMDGFARTDLFQRAYTDERPITFIPTYDR